MTTETTKPPTEDLVEFGEGTFVYCAQHLAPHRVGWCTVSLMNKVALGKTWLGEPMTVESAVYKCQYLGLKLYQP